MGLKELVVAVMDDEQDLFCFFVFFFLGVSDVVRLVSIRPKIFEDS